MKPLLLTLLGLAVVLPTGCQSTSVTPSPSARTVAAFTTVAADGRRVTVPEDSRPGVVDILDRMSAVDAPQEIWSMSQEATFESWTIEVVLKAGHAVVTCDPPYSADQDAAFPLPDDPAQCTFVRELSAGELAELRQFLSGVKADDLPNLNQDAADGAQYYYCHADASAAHLLYMNNPEDLPSSKYERMVDYFRNLCHFDRMTARYALPRPIPGLKLVWAHPTLPALAVWAHGHDVRVLLGSRIDYHGPDAWCAVTHGPPRPTTRPSTLPADFSPDAYASSEDLNEKLSFNVCEADTPFWRVRSGRRSVHFGWPKGGSASGLYLFDGQNAPALLPKTSAAPATKIGCMLMTPDGHYVVAVRDDQLVCYDIDARKPIPIADAKAAGLFKPLAYIPALGKVLLDSDERQEPSHIVLSGGIFGGRPSTSPTTEPATEERRIQRLLDPATGQMTDLRRGANTDPYGIYQQPPKHRGLQPAHQAGVVWEAYPDSECASAPRLSGIWVCRYDTRTFRVLNRMHVRGLDFDSDHMWVDDSAGRLYLIHKTAVFSMPLPPDIYRNVPPPINVDVQGWP